MSFPRFPAFLPLARILLAGSSLALAACAQHPARPAATATGQTPVQDQADKPASAKADSAQTAPTAVVKPEPKLPKQDLTEAVLYEYLLAEIAGQRGAVGLSAQAYADLARHTRDPRIAKRATEVAMYARMPAAAIEAAKIWYETEPSSVQALQALTSLLIGAKRQEEALPYLQAFLEKDDSGAGFLQLPRLLAGNKDKALTLNLVQRLAQPHPKIAQAHYALAQAAAGAEQGELALTEARAASKLQPDWSLPVLLEAQLLQRQSNALALQHLAAFLERHPESPEVRMTYARVLVAEKKYIEARGEFQTLSRDFPDNTDVVFAVGVLSLQLQDYALAQANFTRLLTLPYRDKDTVRMYLAQIAEDQKNYPEALRWYDEVSGGDAYLRAQIRYALVLSKQGKLDEARAHLKGVEVESDSARVQLLLTEAQMLRDAKQESAAFDLIGKALQNMPDQPDLLYDYAMLADKLERADLLESSLKKLIRLKPDHAHAYNALGYSLADRNLRLPEAQGLIEKALQLSPEDPFIIDSMGWVLYRMGKNKEALEYLRKAYASRPDPEIAAHLGEVLWVAGEHREAEKIWLEATSKTPDNDALNGTIKRFKR
ncbi:MAG: tetratricopeptide repeat protein [Burkholderiales bacterium]|nr:tetratricopeptide repeat protein [Burkholderiales bacterium]